MKSAIPFGSFRVSPGTYLAVQHAELLAGSLELAAEQLGEYGDSEAALVFLRTAGELKNYACRRKERAAAAALASGGLLGRATEGQ